MTDRKAFLLRLDPTIHEALKRWAAAERRSLNGQIEFVLRRALQQSGRLGSGTEDLEPGFIPPKE